MIPFSIKLISIVCVLFFIERAIAQNVGINSTGAIPHASAILDVDAAPAFNKGFAMPRLTTAQRLAIVAPVDGLQVYDTNLKDYYYCDGGVWDCVSMRAGTVTYFANVAAPRGYLVCDGTAHSTTQYPELFNAIGYTYGGAGAMFNVPDLRGEFIRGIDNGRGADPARVLGSWQSGSPVVHDDTPGVAAQNGDFSLDVVSANYCDTWALGAGNIPNAYWSNDPVNWTVYSGAAAMGMISASRPRNVALLPCIKY